MPYILFFRKESLVLPNRFVYEDVASLSFDILSQLLNEWPSEIKKGFQKGDVVGWCTHNWVMGMQKDICGLVCLSRAGSLWSRFGMKRLME